jgi:hypothetical protein
MDRRVAVVAGIGMLALIAINAYGLAFGHPTNGFGDTIGTLPRPISLTSQEGVK